MRDGRDGRTVDQRMARPPVTGSSPLSSANSSRLYSLTPRSSGQSHRSRSTSTGSRARGGHTGLGEVGRGLVGLELQLPACGVFPPAPCALEASRRSFSSSRMAPRPDRVLAQAARRGLVVVMPVVALGVVVVVVVVAGVLAAVVVVGVGAVLTPRRRRRCRGGPPRLRAEPVQSRSPGALRATGRRRTMGGWPPELVNLGHSATLGDALSAVSVTAGPFRDPLDRLQGVLAVVVLPVEPGQQVADLGRHRRHRSRRPARRRRADAPRPASARPR